MKNYERLEVFSLEMKRVHKSPSQVIEEQEAKLESIISAKESLMRSEDEKLCEYIKKVETENVEQDGKIQNSDARIDQLKDNHTSHSEILEAILKELKEKDKVIDLIFFTLFIFLFMHNALVYLS